MKSILIGLIALSNISFALVYLEGSLGFGMGDKTFKETSGSSNYDHDASILSFEATGRVGLKTLGLSFGPVLTYGKMHTDTIRKDNTASIADQLGYDNTFNFTYMGAFVGFDFPALPIRIWGEYYFSANIENHYADPKAANPFTEGDKVEGSGMAIGIAYRAAPFFNLFALYRSVGFDTWKFKNANTNTYSEADLMQGIIGASLAFGL